jgi:thiol-disulfide isomerase/thioredoxin
MMVMAGAAWAQEQPKPATVPAEQGQPEKKKEEPKAKAPKLTIGDKAPALTVEKWVRGEPVTGFEKGRVYVVEFWATWCGLCIKSMPHLTELQSKYKDKGVTIVGVTSKDPNNTLDKVEAMVKEKGSEGMGYTVGWDTERKTNEAYMKASGQNGIPCAFVVNQEGVIAYIGHPIEMDEPLAQIVAGKYDLKKAAEEYRQEQERADKEMASMAEVNKIMQKFKSLMDSGEYAKAYDSVREPLEGVLKDNARGLNFIAWTIVDPENPVDKPDLDLAYKAATRAVELTKEKDGAILDTLALIVFKKGDVTRAIELQKKAIAAIPAAEEEMKAELEGRLKEFEAAAKKK